MLMREPWRINTPNLSDEESEIRIIADEIGLESFQGYRLEELWSGESLEGHENSLNIRVLAHGAKLYEIKQL
ncbi:MAG: hypothetical protein GX319_02950 [Clostridiales bacterium]|jgi:hypothetical protein|nr:hypothetical protein [Clostridiales bacterium]